MPFAPCISVQDTAASLAFYNERAALERSELGKYA